MLDRLRRLAHRAGQYAGLAATALGIGDDLPWSGPLYAQLSVSDLCDHRCAMCPYHPPSEPPTLAPFGGTRPGLMSLETFTRLVDDLHALGTRRVDLVGRGEPLLNPRIAEMVAHAKSRGFTVTLISNGSQLDERLAGALLQGGLDRLRVSLDAASAESYALIHVGESARAFARIQDNLRRLARLRNGRSTHITLSYTIGAANFRELPRMVALTRELGADAAHFQHVLLLSSDAEPLVLDAAARQELAGPLLSAAEQAATTLGLETNLASFAAWSGDHEAGAVPCYVGSYFTVVLGNGQVMPCCQTERALGSLDDSSFTDIWRGQKYREFRRAARKLPERSPALDTCACDRCYFRPHNVSVHNLLHPLARIPTQQPAALLSVDQLLRMSRSDRRRT
jgi:MoaA/NifB/PqqE/SkfB family radical SAM enzyme